MTISSSTKSLLEVVLSTFWLSLAPRRLEKNDPANIRIATENCTEPTWVEAKKPSVATIGDDICVYRIIPISVPPAIAILEYIGTVLRGSLWRVISRGTTTIPPPSPVSPATAPPPIPVSRTVMIFLKFSLAIIWELSFGGLKKIVLRAVAKRIKLKIILTWRGSILATISVVERIPMAIPIAKMTPQSYLTSSFNFLKLYVFIKEFRKMTVRDVPITALGFAPGKSA